MILGTIQSWNSPGQNTGVGSLSFLQGLFPTQGSNRDLLHCRWILYQLSYSLPVEPQGKPKNTGVGSLSLLQWLFPTHELNWGLLHSGRFFTNWAIREVPPRSGDMGSISGLGRLLMLWGNQARVPQLLSPCPRGCGLKLLRLRTVTTEAVHSGARALQ